MLANLRQLKLKVKDPLFDAHRYPEGYFVLKYDDGDKVYVERTVHVYRMNQLTESQWMDEVKALYEEIEKFKETLLTKT